MNEDEGIQKKIIFSLYRTKHIGSRHTPMDKVCKRLTPISCKNIRKEIKNLMKKQLILPYKTGHDPDIRLNPKKLEQIGKFISQEIKNLKKI